MGGCSSTGLSETDLIPEQEGQPKSQVYTEAEDSAMSERSDFNRFMEVSNVMTKMVKERYDRCDELWRGNRQLKKENERLTAENERLRQMYVKHNFDFCKIRKCSILLRHQDNFAGRI